MNAAKQCSVDNLCGTVDAMAWGKEPFAGTSGPFEIIYSGKVRTVTAAKFRHNIVL
jgi:DNA-directed RNA polymerase-4 subunit 1